MSNIERNTKIAKFIGYKEVQNFHSSWSKIIPVIRHCKKVAPEDSVHMVNIFNALQGLNISDVNREVIKFIDYLRPKITKKDFLEWYFVDDHDYREVGHSVEKCLEAGECFSIEMLFNQCNYIEVDGKEYEPIEVELID